MSKEQAIKTIMNYVKGIKPKSSFLSVFDTDAKGNVICTSKKRIEGEPLNVQVCRTREDITKYDQMSESEFEKIAAIYEL